MNSHVCPGNPPRGVRTGPGSRGRLRCVAVQSPDAGPGAGSSTGRDAAWRPVVSVCEGLVWPVECEGGDDE